MNNNVLSKSYDLRRLTEEDISIIYDLCINNEIYNKYCPPLPSYESIQKDMVALPPQKEYKDKYYLGYFKDNKLIAVMDLIDKYPNDTTIFIGFFMVDLKCQNKGIGSGIINELIDSVKELGYKDIRLGYVEGNSQSFSFWKKNGFIDTGLRNYYDNYTVIILNKNLH